MAPPTILAHKSSFLTAQTLQLSQALAPSAAWRTSNSSSAEGGLSDRVVDEVLYRANHTLQQHARRVYAPQASRHVAEQIEALYLEVAEKAVRGDSGNGEEDDEGAAASKKGDEEAKFLRVGADFASDEVISTLPSTWDQHSSSQAEAHPSEAQRYADLAASLSSLSARRKEARARLDRLRRMRTLLSPLAPVPLPSDSSQSSSSTGAGERGGSGLLIDKVQPNLVTRNGELEKELERMRVLLVRVAGRVAQLPDANPESGDDAVMEDVETSERSKVDRLLGGF
ncbi:kinetochore Sim4 complex subunit Fta4 [Hypoxylon sp. FL1857]|nr:kinetochore Sim4 complex subunit Fta4 [Hypoxylon sp. FL1857]